MGFFTKIATMVAAAAAVASATNTVTFVSQDSTTRKIIFTPSSGYSEIDSIEVAGLGTETVSFPSGWVGNWYSVSEGWDDITYFDVSAIVNADDHDGVHEMWPASENTVSVKTLMSGCTIFPCNTAYYLADDVQTVATTETELYCSLGSQTNTTSKRDAAKVVPRNFVLGKF
ncbi:hypothetical protein G7054_g11519 [Neopestalotiopsis clavispora]|nr:hypothetical protein G7054_g11519 [Neopestalotiopsis clavispora]